MKNKFKETLLDALNRMDELVDELGSLDEQKQQAKDYELLFNFISERI